MLNPNFGTYRNMEHVECRTCRHTKNDVLTFSDADYAWVANTASTPRYITVKRLCTVSDHLAAGWHLVVHDTYGAFAARLFLVSRLPASFALKVSLSVSAQWRQLFFGYLCSAKRVCLSFKAGKVPLVKWRPFLFRLTVQSAAPALLSVKRRGVLINVVLRRWRSSSTGKAGSWSRHGLDSDFLMMFASQTLQDVTSIECLRMLGSLRSLAPTEYTEIIIHSAILLSPMHQHDAFFCACTSRLCSRRNRAFHPCHLNTFWMKHCWAFQ